MQAVYIDPQAIRYNIHRAEAERKPVWLCQAWMDAAGAALLETERQLYSRMGAPIAKLRYCNEKPLSCGARVWIETGAEVRLRGLDGEVHTVVEADRRIRRIHINQIHLRQNRLDVSLNKPVITCKIGSRQNVYGHALELVDGAGGVALSLQYLLAPANRLRLLAYAKPPEGLPGRHTA